MLARDDWPPPALKRVYAITTAFVARQRDQGGRRDYRGLSSTSKWLYPFNTMNSTVLPGSRCLRSEFTILTLELRRLQCAVSDDEWRDKSIEVPSWTQRFDDACGEPDVPTRSRLTPHAACTQATFDCVPRQAEVFLPVCRKDHSCEMAPG